MVQISLNSNDFNVTFDEDVVLVIATERPNKIIVESPRRCQEVSGGVLALLSSCHGIELALYF